MRISFLLLFIFLYSILDAQDIQLTQNGEIKTLQIQKYKDGEKIRFGTDAKDATAEKQLLEFRNRAQYVHDLINDRTREQDSLTITIMSIARYLETNKGKIKDVCKIDATTYLKEQCGICLTTLSGLTNASTSNEALLDSLTKEWNSVKNLLDSLTRKSTPDKAQEDSLRGVSSRLKVRLDNLTNLSATSEITPQPNCNQDWCFCYDINQKLKQYAEIYQRLKALRYQRNLLLDLLCQRKDLFQTVITGSEQVGPADEDAAYAFSSRERSKGMPTLNEPYYFSLLPDTLYPRSVIGGYSYWVNGDAWKFYPSDSMFRYSYALRKGGAFEVKRVNNLKQLLLDWHNKTANILDQNEIKKYTASPKESEAIVGLAASLDCSTNCDVDNLNKLNTKLTAYDSAWCNSSSIAHFLKKWLWYSGGDLKLNYFRFSDPDKVKQQTRYKAAEAEYAKLGTNDPELKNLQELAEKIAAIKACLTCSVKALDTLEQLQAKLATLEKERRLPNKLKEIISQNQTDLLAFSSPSILVHSFKLPTLSADTKLRLLFYNEVNEFEAFSLKNRPIPDNERVYIGIANASKIKNNKLDVKQEKEAYDDSGEVVKAGKEIANELGSQATALLPFAAPLTKVLSSLFGSNKLPAGSATQFFSIGAGSKGPVASDVKSCEDLRRELQEKYWRWQLLQRIIAEYNDYPTPSTVEEKEPTTAAYATYTIKGEMWQAPYTNKVTFKVEGSKEAIQRYQVGKLRLLAVGAGIFFNSNFARQVSVDSSSSGLTIKNSDQRAKFVIGLKLYPFKSFTADDGLLPKYPLRRFSIFSGFEVVKPLNNLYVGLGYDIVPGLHISTGWHFYKNDVYRIQNNQIIDQTTRYTNSGLYYGVTLDPGLLAAVLKAIIK